MAEKKAVKKSGRKALTYLIIVIIIIALLAYIFAAAKQSAQIIYLKAPTNATISKTPTIFSIENKEYAIYLGSVGNNYANIYIAQMPAFVAPLLYVNLTLHNTTRINAGTTYANLEVILNSISNNSVSITLVPVSTNLYLTPDSEKIIIVNVQQPSAKISIKVANTSQTTQTTTTIVSTASTTIPAKIANATNTTKEKISKLINEDKFYPLIVNLTSLYRNTSACTPELYNTTYFSYYNAMPSPTYSYHNVSINTPYDLKMEITGQKGYYIVSFVALTRNAQFNNTAALSINLNLNTSTIVNTTINPYGIYGGLNYTVMEKIYEKASVIGGPCGIYVVH
ncbi:MAG: hypothetical protein ACP5SA_01120 [Candidatus Micrarchaeia archaeon]